MFTYLQHSDPTIPYYRNVSTLQLVSGLSSCLQSHTPSPNGRLLVVPWQQSIGRVLVGLAGSFCIT